MIKKRFKRFLLILFVLVVLAIAFSVGYLLPRVPSLNTQLFDYDQNAVIFDKFDQPYQNLQGAENRQTVNSEEISPITKSAFIAIEDKRFYSHPGIDIFGIGRALAEVFSNQDLTGSGGSTITQQLIKLTHLTSERSLERKFDEWVLAIQLEQVYSKDQILTAYLNKVNFHGAEGIQAAARQYFGKNAADLDLAESAILAAIPNSPNYFDPYTYDETSQIITNENNEIVLNPNNNERAQKVLEEMYKQGYITEADKNTASQEILTNPHLQFNNPNRVYSYFTDAVYFQLLSDLTDVLGISEEEVVKFINTSGLKIYSTVDPNVQAAMEVACQNESLFPPRSNSSVNIESLTGEVYNPEVGMTVINNEDGSVCGMIGGRNNNASLTLNRATSRFQTGSSTKPITTYAPALEEKTISLATVYNDAPIDVAGWQPQNSSQTFNGPTTVRDGIIHSVNTVAVQALCDLGIEKSLNYSNKLGLEVSETDKNPQALALGGYTDGFTTEEMAAAYSTFPRGGDYIRPYLYRRVEDNKGNVLIENQPVRENVFSSNVSFLITDVLKQACTVGTTQINIPNTEVAGKTGTTDNLVNAWFCGYTPNYSMAIWYGYDQSEIEINNQVYPLSIEIAGGSKPGPAAMFENVMSSIVQPSPAFNIQTDVIPLEIDKTSGKKPTTATDLDPRGTQRFREYFINGTEPTEEDDVHVLTSFDTSTGYKAVRNCPVQSVKQMGLLDLSKIKVPSTVTLVDKNFVPSSLSQFSINSSSCPSH